MQLSQIMSQDRVTDLDPLEPLLVAEDATVRDAVEAMRSDRRGAVLICRDGRLIGIFTERDLLKKVFHERRPLEIPIASVMHTTPRFIRNDGSAFDALRIFQSGGFRHLPIVDAEDRPTGMLSVKCMVHYLADLYPEVVFNLPPEHGRVSSVMDGG